MNTRTAFAAAAHKKPANGYGAPVRKRDQFGREILALPPEFDYITFGDIGAEMSDGNPTPVAHDGMAAFPYRHNIVRLIRNHEDRAAPGAGSVLGPTSTKYDPLGGGGTSTLDFDLRRRRFVRDFLSLNGTTVNCAGGIAWRGRGWITGEEIVTGPAQGWGQKHGYQFFVPLDRDEPQLTEPLTAMGRFAHEACAVDQSTGIVYLTEDPGSGVGAGFYRFLPSDRDRLSQGGRLEMLAIAGRPQYDAREDQQLRVSPAAKTRPRPARRRDRRHVRRFRCWKSPRVPSGQEGRLHPDRLPRRPGDERVRHRRPRPVFMPGVRGGHEVGSSQRSHAAAMPPAE